MNFISSIDTVNILIKSIENKQSNVYIRFGDGDFYLMDGGHDMLAAPSDEMIENYKLLSRYLNNKHMISIPFYCKDLNTLEYGMKPGVHEYPTEIVNNFIEKIKSIVPKVDTLYSHVALHQVLVNNPLIYSKFLQSIITNNSTIIIGDKNFNKDTINFYFGKNIYIGGNSNNSFLEKDIIWKEFEEAINYIDRFTVCILALGCGGRAMCHKFIELINDKHKDVLIIDIGSSIDVLMGLRNTRAWVELTNPDIEIIDNELIKFIEINNTNQKILTHIGTKYNTDKCTYHKYTDFYDALFAYNKNNVKSIVEIGVLEGSSIKMWRDYFINSTIFCFDINPDCAKYVHNLPNVIFDCLNQDSVESLKAPIAKYGLNSIDIILDDGGHFSTQQRNTLNVYWSCLKSGGIYIVEDIHTNVKHWYPNGIHWNHNKKYWDESPTLLETLYKIQSGIEVGKELDFPQSEIKQIIFWSQPSTTSALYILIKK